MRLVKIELTAADIQPLETTSQFPDSFVRFAADLRLRCIFGVAVMSELNECEDRSLTFVLAVALGVCRQDSGGFRCFRFRELL